MKCKLERIRKTIEDISSFTKTKNGVTRFSYSDEYKEVRNYLIEAFKEINLSATVDSVGNIRVRILGKNKDLPSVIIGSHIDSVYQGGKFDGVVGVVAGLEIARVLSENNYIPNNTIEIIAFAEEEGSNFNSTMLGSKCITEKYKVEDLKEIKNINGKSAYNIMKDFGLKPDNLQNDILKKEKTKAMIELHIEQGGVLDRENKNIGIVTHIVGMETLEIKIKGEANHAGTTPMNMRCDALLESSKLILAINNIVNKAESSTAVATVGSINVIPNSSNVIAGEVVMYVDIRDITDESIEGIIKNIKKHIIKLDENNECIYTIESISKSNSIELSPKIRKHIENYLVKNNISYKCLPSGAVHDAAQLASITETAMIFVPSINGKSHCCEEDTKYEDIKIGCDILTSLVIDLTNE